MFQNDQKKMSAMEDMMTKKQLVKVNRRGKKTGSVTSGAAKRPGKKQESHAIISKLSDCQTDPWWIKKLSDIAKSKSKKMILRETELAIKKGTKIGATFVFDPEIDDDLLSFQLVEFLKKNCMMYSPDERLSMEQKEEEKEIPWTKLKVSQKETCIAYYIDNEREKYGLTFDQGMELYHTIIMLINTKQLGKDSFIVENGKLVKIENLEFDKEKSRYFLTKIQPITVTKLGKKDVKKPSIYKQKWNKYISEIDKRRKKHTGKPINNETTNVGTEVETEKTDIDTTQNE